VILCKSILACRRPVGRREVEVEVEIEVGKKNRRSYGE